MLLSITCQGPQARSVGFLLHKHPDRFQTIDLSYGRCHVFYPEYSDDLVTACMLLDIDPVDIAKNKRQRRDRFALAGYVNDRPYVASSLLSVAIANAFGTAMAGTCKKMPHAVQTTFNVELAIEVLPSRGGGEHVRRLFEPLGFETEAIPVPLDDQYPDWGNSPYYSVRLTGQSTVARLLQQLYVLVPVFDNQKHYFIDFAEAQKLLDKGQGWLESHPEKKWIVDRYLKYNRSLARRTLTQVTSDAPASDSPDPAAIPEPVGEQKLNLNTQRLAAVQQQLEASGATSVIDLGCGEGKLLQRLIKQWQFQRLVGMDVSVASLEIAAKRLKLAERPKFQADRVELMHGSLMYRDRRFSGFDAASVVEVIEHLEPSQLRAFEQVVFKHARPATVVITTPNREYNVRWPSLPAGKFRHPDHRFEWDRATFEQWAQSIATTHGYSVKFLPIGDHDDSVGSPTQMAVFAIRPGVSKS